MIWLFSALNAHHVATHIQHWGLRWAKGRGLHADPRTGLVILEWWMYRCTFLTEVGTRPVMVMMVILLIGVGMDTHLYSRWDLKYFNLKMVDNFKLKYFKSHLLCIALPHAHFIWYVVFFGRSIYYRWWQTEVDLHQSTGPVTTFWFVPLLFLCSMSWDQQLYFQHKLGTLFILFFLKYLNTTICCFHKQVLK